MGFRPSLQVSEIHRKPWWSVYPLSATSISCSVLLPFKAWWSREGQISQVPWENQAKMIFSLLVTAAVDSKKNEGCICCFPKYYLILLLWILVKSHTALSVLKTNKKYKSSFTISFSIKNFFNFKSDWSAIQLPFLGLHLPPCPCIIPFYCLISLKITPCFHATNQVLTWFLQAPQSLQQCLFFSPEGIY